MIICQLCIWILYYSYAKMSDGNNDRKTGSRDLFVSEFVRSREPVKLDRRK